MNITTIGLDLAKNVFQVHAVDQQGRVNNLTLEDVFLGRGNAV